MPKPMDIAEIERVNKLEAEQRRLEREVRKAKREVAGLTDPAAAETAKRKLRVKQKALRDFVNENSDVLRRDPWRERNDGVPKDWGTTRGGVATDDSDHLEFVAASTANDAQRFAQEVLGLSETNAYQTTMNIGVSNAVNEAIFKISSEFGSLSEYGYLNGIAVSRLKDGPYAMYVPSKQLVLLNKVTEQSDAIKILAKDAAYQYSRGGWSSPDPFHSIYHELGHAVQHMYLDNDPALLERIKILYAKVYCDILGADTPWVTDRDVIAECGIRAKAAGFSYYGLRNVGDFVAEAIAQYYCLENPGTITDMLPP